MSWQAESFVVGQTSETFPFDVEYDDEDLKDDERRRIDSMIWDG